MTEWDFCHVENDKYNRDLLAPPLDQALSALMKDRTSGDCSNRRWLWPWGNSAELPMSILGAGGTTGPTAVWAES